VSGNAVRPGRVIIYGKKDCMACLRCKQVAEIWGLHFEYKDIEIPEIREEYLQVASVHIVPLIIWNGRKIMGYEQFAEVLENEINDFGHGEL
jgi:glutaredoxin